jgi:hypothetical protein
MMPPSVFRFAPSPNGYLHLGHAYSAWLNFDLAAQTGGRFLLRIEDIDTARCKPEFETAIYQDLAWLGMTWETPVRRQSGHLAEYAMRWTSFPPRDWSTRVSKAGPRLRNWWRSGRRGLPGRVTLTGRRFILARQSCFRRMSARDGSRRMHLARYGSTWRRPAQAPAISTGSSAVRVPMARPAR